MTEEEQIQIGLRFGRIEKNLEYITEAVKGLLETTRLLVEGQRLEAKTSVQAERQASLEAKVESQTWVEEVVRHLAEGQIRLEDTMARQAEGQIRLEAKMAEQAERFDAFINVVERHISDESRHLQPPGTQDQIPPENRIDPEPPA